MTTPDSDTMFGDVIKLLCGDRPAASDRLLYKAAIAIGDAMPALNQREAMEVETLLAYGVHFAGNLPAITDHARSRMQSPFSIRHMDMTGIDNVETVAAVIEQRLATYAAARTASTDGTASKRLEALMKEQAALHPRLGLSFGYIGNCSFGGPTYDHRSWMVFAKLATPACHNACDVHFGGVPTSQLGKLMQRAEKELAAWCDEQEQRLDAQQIRVVGAR